MEISQICKKLLIKEPFYGIFMLGLSKKYDSSIPTMGVCKNGINVELLVNKEFLDSLTEEMALAVLKHELNHILLKHIFYDDCYPEHTIANYAADCSVNSYIPELQTEPWIYPARFNLNDKESMKFYYYHFMEHVNPENGFNGMDTVDDHSSWRDFKNMSEAEKKLVEGQIDAQAKQTAEYCKNRMPGSIPGHLKNYIDSLFEILPPVFDWRKYFRRVIGNSIKSYIKSTRYKPSFRFKGSPGNILKFKPKILVAVDTSGSVGDDDLKEFFSEIHNVYRAGVQVDVVEFDTTITHNFTYKGKSDKIEIHGRGGTDVSEVIEFYKKEPTYSTLIVFTDGYLNVDFKHIRNLVWVISRNGSKQNYPGLAIYMDESNNNN